MSMQFPHFPNDCLGIVIYGRIKDHGFPAWDHWFYVDNDQPLQDIPLSSMPPQAEGAGS